MEYLRVQGLHLKVVASVSSAKGIVTTTTRAAYCCTWYGVLVLRSHPTRRSLSTQ